MTENPRRVTLVERASLKGFESIMSNYVDPQQALLDLIDNAVDNRIMQGADSPISIHVRIAHDEISIYNIGGHGLDLDGLEQFLNWGHSSKTDQIGQYGVGGKAAMGFLGQGIEIRCSARGSNEEYRLVDANWEKKENVPEQQHQCEINHTDILPGYYQVKIINLKHHIQKVGKVKERLGDIYKPLIESNQVRITVNGKKEEVPALVINYDTSHPSLQPQRLSLETGHRSVIRLSFGVMEPGQTLRPGFRGYYRGRLIEGEQFFGYPDPTKLTQAARFIGEAHLDHLQVTTNKARFIRNATWDDAAAVINRAQALQNFFAQLPNLKIDLPTKLDDYEQVLAKKAKRALEHIAGQTGLLSRIELPGSARFRLPPSPPTTPYTPPADSGIHKNLEGATPPDKDANVGPNVKRWGVLSKWDVINMGTPEIRAKIIEEDGRENLKINIDHPMYQVEKAAGDTALELYIIETAVAEVGKLVYANSSVETYMDWYNRVIKEIGLYYQFNRTSSKRK